MPGQRHMLTVQGTANTSNTNGLRSLADELAKKVATLYENDSGTIRVTYTLHVDGIEVVEGVIEFEEVYADRKDRAQPFKRAIPAIFEGIRGQLIRAGASGKHQIKFSVQAQKTS